MNRHAVCASGPDVGGGPLDQYPAPLLVAPRLRCSEGRPRGAASDRGVARDEPVADRTPEIPRACIVGIRGRGASNAAVASSGRER